MLRTANCQMDTKQGKMKKLVCVQYSGMVPFLHAYGAPQFGFLVLILLFFLGHLLFLKAGHCKGGIMK